MTILRKRPLPREQNAIAAGRTEAGLPGDGTAKALTPAARPA